jgi:hypothetical protein
MGNQYCAVAGLPTGSWTIRHGRWRVQQRRRLWLLPVGGPGRAMECAAPFAEYKGHDSAVCGRRSRVRLVTATTIARSVQILRWTSRPSLYRQRARPPTRLIPWSLWSRVRDGPRQTTKSSFGVDTNGQSGRCAPIDPSHRPRLLVRQRRLPRGTRPAWRVTQHEPQGRPLGQRGVRVLLRHSREGAIGIAATAKPKNHERAVGERHREAL